jgi:hypothetical protein
MSLYFCSFKPTRSSIRQETANFLRSFLTYRKKAGIEIGIPAVSSRIDSVAFSVKTTNSNRFTKKIIRKGCHVVSSPYDYNVNFSPAHPLLDVPTIYLFRSYSTYFSVMLNSKILTVLQDEDICLEWRSTFDDVVLFLLFTAALVEF